MKRRKYRRAPVSTLRSRLNERMREKDDWGSFKDFEDEKDGEPFFLIAAFKGMHKFLLFKIIAAMAVVLVVALLYRGDYQWSRSAVGSLREVVAWDMEFESLAREAVPAFRAVWSSYGNGALLPSGSSAADGSPLPGRLAAGYGLRENASGDGEEMHYGIDITAPAGTAVKAVLPGEVSSIEGEDGRAAVIIDHAEGWQSIYLGLEQFQVKVGDAVDGATILGVLGVATLYEQPHLHFELRYRGRPVKPTDEWLNYFTEPAI